MRIVLVRHAKSDYPASVPDHDRPLAPRGRIDAPVAGEWLDAHIAWDPFEPPTVLVSSATRAQQTWECMAPRLSARWADVIVQHVPEAYAAPAPRLLDLVGDRGTATTILIAHNPGLHQVVLGARPSALRDAASVKFPTCAIAVLETGSAGDYGLIDFAIPRG